jgi:cyclopropane fatty-acyl-phospholipid synthase-like methyltransferase
MSRHVYSSEFYDYIDTGSRNSAQVVSRLLLGELKIGSLLDVGSGHGAWAKEWSSAGVAEVIAVDGAYVNADQLVVPADTFKAHDLSTALELGRRFDLVQSLEVAEHLSAEHADIFVDNLIRHGDVILFSAAVPHQGGEHHVNEQPPEYWRQKFAGRGYQVFDWVRARIVDNREVKAWYRFNTFIYANEAGQKRLSQAIVNTRVSNDERLQIGGDFAWTLRRTAVRMIPDSFVKPLAIAKSIVEVQLRGDRFDRRGG